MNKQGSSGVYIAFVGIDGSGKTSVANAIKSWLESKGKKCVLVKEPDTSSRIGELIKLAERGVLNYDAKIMALLFAANRLEFCEKIRKWKEKGFIIISDRCYICSIAYQSAQGIDENWLKEINKFAERPDLVILLDVSPRVALDRIEPSSIFERGDFLAKVRETYLKLSERFKNIIVVDAEKPFDNVVEDVKKILEERLSLDC